MFKIFVFLLVVVLLQSVQRIQGVAVHVFFLLLLVSLYITFGVTIIGWDGATIIGCAAGLGGGLLLLRSLFIILKL